MGKHVPQETRSSPSRAPLMANHSLAAHRLSPQMPGAFEISMAARHRALGMHKALF